MPWAWETETGEAPEFSGALFYAEGQPPLARLHLSAHNSLTPRGFVWFIGASFALILVPLIAVLGSVVFWALLPFLMAALAGIWWALRRSWSDKAVTETLEVWTDRVALDHRPGRGQAKRWEANAHWVAVHLHPSRGRIRNYITLTGSGDGREVELGSFLTEDERAMLAADLRRVLAAAAASALAP